MNTDMFLQPEVAAEELSVKLRAQRYQMHESWIGTCYQEVLNSAPTLIDAALRAHPTKGAKRGLARRIEAAKMHANMFAANEKDDNPVPILIAALAWGGMYMPVGGAPTSGGVLLVPPGFSISRFTRPTEMQFWLSGLSAKEHGVIPFPLDNVRRDTQYGVNIMTHFPPADYTKTDTENPQVTFNELLRRVAIANHYKLDFLAWSDNKQLFELAVTDFRNAEKAWFRFKPDVIINRLGANLDNPDTGNPIGTIPELVDDIVFKGAPEFHVSSQYVEHILDYFTRDDSHKRYDFTARTRKLIEDYKDDTHPLSVFLWRPHMVMEMYSALYCARPGPETGFMMLGYPKSTISIQEDTQELLITLRQRHGCGIVNAQNLCLLPDIQCGGMIMGHGAVLAQSAVEYIAPEEDDDEYEVVGDDLVLMCKLESTPWFRLMDDPLFVFQNLKGPLSDVIAQKSVYDTTGEYPDLSVIGRLGDTGEEARERKNEMAIFAFSGAVWDNNIKLVHTNTGHLEGLDRETACDALEGRLKTRAHQQHIVVD